MRCHQIEGLNGAKGLAFEGRDFLEKEQERRFNDRDAIPEHLRSEEGGRRIDTQTQRRPYSFVHSAFAEPGEAFYA